VSQKLCNCLYYIIIIFVKIDRPIITANSVNRLVFFLRQLTNFYKFVGHNFGGIFGCNTNWQIRIYAVGS